MQQRCSIWIWIILSLVVGCTSTQQQISPTTEPVGEWGNPFCPVFEVDEGVKVLVKPRFYTVYQGKKVHFCCRDCIEYFNASPERYLFVLTANSRSKEDMLKK